jgi:nucleoside-diphosphate-sugar epimerase
METVVIAGAAGLVGQNLIPRLKRSGRFKLIAIDKHAANIAVLRRMHPDIEVIEADMAEPGPWQDNIAACDALVMLQAQIGGLDPEPFRRNNVLSTQLALDALKQAQRPYLVHISSSVINSMARDLYTESKRAQEDLAVTSGVAHVILRPTLMFGWFDRKHLGWLRRFMDRTPLFPVPGDGKFLRQPLYAGDFSNIVAQCIERRPSGTYDISGLERINYIDLVRAIKTTVKARTAIVTIPYSLFWLLLKTYSFVDRDPPFTTSQLAALVTPDLFPEIDWPGIFGVTRTPLNEALAETFLDPTYSTIVLDF